MGRHALPLGFLLMMVPATAAWAQDDEADAPMEEPPPAARTADEVDEQNLEMLEVEHFNDGEAPAAQGTSRARIYEGEADPSEEAGYAKLSVVSKKLPSYPVELQSLYGEQAIRCRADVWVDAKGKAQRIAMVDCPDGFHVVALEAMQKWKWEKPSGYVPDEGVLTSASTGFTRPSKRNYFPGVTYFRSPDEVTSDPSLPVLLKSGKMPRYPRQVNAGDDICLVELTIDARGNTTDFLIDECAVPYRDQLARVVKSWKWWWTQEHGKKETHRLVTEVVFRL
ncbi:MAG: hypothetical protein KC656_25650 [Myxococcales bacterium]|nr:hypothetical protein [Myxococcales bacterium]